MPRAQIGPVLTTMQTGMHVPNANKYACSCIPKDNNIIVLPPGNISTMASV